MEIDPHNERDRTATRGIQAPDQDPDRAAVCGNRRHAVLGFADFRQITMRKVDGGKSLAGKPSDQIIDLAA
jgi:hypothetical protein